MHPALTDVVTHLGAVKDSDRDSTGNAGVVRVPLALGLYTASTLNKHVSTFSSALTCLDADRKLLTLPKERSVSCNSKNNDFISFSVFILL